MLNLGRNHRLSRHALRGVSICRGKCLDDSVKQWLSRHILSHLTSEASRCHFAVNAQFMCNCFVKVDWRHWSTTAITTHKRTNYMHFLNQQNYESSVKQNITKGERETQVWQIQRVVIRNAMQSFVNIWAGLKWKQNKGRAHKIKLIWQRHTRMNNINLYKIPEVQSNIQLKNLICDISNNDSSSRLKQK
jgi:hypothetical protein